MKLIHLTPDKYDDYKDFFNNQQYNLCVYSLPSIIAWATNIFQPYVAVDGESLIVCYEYDAMHAGRRHILLPVSPAEEKTPEELYDIAQKIGFGQYWFVPEHYIDAYGKERLSKLFRIEFQESLSDYIYLTEDLAYLKGNKYSKKRNLVNQFKRNILNAHEVVTSPITVSDVSECIEFLEKWCEEKKCDDDENTNLACEKRAIIRAMENIDVFDLKTLHLRIDGEVCAFAIGAKLTETMGVLHFEKAYPKIKGLYQYFDRECARTLFDGLTYINKESDLEDPGIAKSKKSYYPVMMANSYGLILR